MHIHLTVEIPEFRDKEIKAVFLAKSGGYLPELQTSPLLLVGSQRNIRTLPRRARALNWEAADSAFLLPEPWIRPFSLDLTPKHSSDTPVQGQDSQFWQQHLNPPSSSFQ